MYWPEFNSNRLSIIKKLNEIIFSLEGEKRDLTDNEFRAILTARNFIKAYYDNAEHELKNNGYIEKYRSGSNEVKKKNDRRL